MIGYASGQHAVSIAKRGKPIPRRRGKPRRGPVVDLKYRKFVRTFGCVVCFKGELVWCPEQDAQRFIQGSRTEFAHVGQRGLWQLCSDYDGLPLCRDEHHRNGPKSHHVLGKRFWTFHGLNRPALIAEANQRYIADGGVLKTA